MKFLNRNAEGARHQVKLGVQARATGVSRRNRGGNGGVAGEKCGTGSRDLNARIISAVATEIAGHAVNYEMINAHARRGYGQERPDGECARHRQIRMIDDDAVRINDHGQIARGGDIGIGCGTKFESQSRRTIKSCDADFNVNLRGIFTETKAAADMQGITKIQSNRGRHHHQRIIEIQIDRSAVAGRNVQTFAISGRRRSKGGIEVDHFSAGIIATIDLHFKIIRRNGEVGRQPDGTYRTSRRLQPIVSGGTGRRLEQCERKTSVRQFHTRGCRAGGWPIDADKHRHVICANQQFGYGRRRGVGGRSIRQINRRGRHGCDRHAAVDINKSVEVQLQRARN